MKNNKLRIASAGIAALILTIFLFGCATIQPAGEQQMLEIIEMINAGDSENLAARSSDVILLDAEIIQNPKLIKNLWEGLAESSFRIADSVIVTNRLLLPTDKAAFGSGPEIDAFFAKYIPEKASLFRVETTSGEYAFILGPSDIGISMIIAFGGPY